MISIHLHNISFYAYHGVHDEERILGGEYILNLEVCFVEKVNVIRELAESINYTDLYIIAKARMDVATPLLETVVMQIGHEIHRQYAQVKEIKISLRKTHPPIEQFTGSVGVSWHKIY